MNDREIFGKPSELAEQGIPMCPATIVEAAGSTPREAGTKMLVRDDGWTCGSAGGGCGEHQTRSAALLCWVV